jgi:hypothetical protein
LWGSNKRQLAWRNGLCAKGGSDFLAARPANAHKLAIAAREVGSSSRHEFACFSWANSAPGPTLTRSSAQGSGLLRMIRSPRVESEQAAVLAPEGCDASSAADPCPRGASRVGCVRETSWAGAVELSTFRPSSARTSTLLKDDEIP